MAREEIPLTEEQKCKWLRILEDRNAMTRAVQMAMQAAADLERRLISEERQLFDEATNGRTNECAWAADLGKGIVYHN